MTDPAKPGSQKSIFRKLWRGHRPEKEVLESPPQLSSKASFLTTSSDEKIPTQSQLLVPTDETRLSSRPRSRSRDRRSEPQGLNVLYEPIESRIADVIFVHGLGGSSISTWTKNGDEETFWPEKYLPSEPGLARARILTFGYTAFFLSQNSSRKMSIMDFARSLLGSLKSETELGFGDVPIIFVAHSLGGLVVKKAYILGQSSENFKAIMSSVSAMMFLGTPHRGSSLAKVLNSLLAVSTIGPTPKHYISELAEDSTMIEDLNEQFRDYGSNLQIASFYETKYTTIGLKRVMIVEKQSAILGYRSEIPQPLDTDHHQLSKFANRDDKSYVRVYKTLKSLIPSAEASASPHGNMENLKILLAVSEAPEDDLSFYSDRRMPETCSWILSNPIYHAWMECPLHAQMLWINGSAGSGKSMLASFLIDHYRREGTGCYYYFFRSGDRIQRSINTFIRTLAFQLAQSNSLYKQYLQELSETGVRVEKSDAKSTWQKLFMSASTQLATMFPIAVVIDGLDESDSPQTLLNLLSSASTNIPLRLLVVSRPTSALSANFDKFPKTMPVTRLSAESTKHDIPLFVEQELQSLHGDEPFRRQVIEQIINGAHGNFLWVHLATQEVLDCQTQGEIEQILQEIPTGMLPLYERMEDAMVKNLRLADQRLSKALLTWVTCSQRPLFLDELSKAIEPDFPHIIDLNYTVGHVCGHLLVIDRKSRVTLIHQTAREYLTKLSTGPFAIKSSKAHEDLFLRCMSCLCHQKLRSRLGQGNLPALSSYAAWSWSFHLQSHAAGSERILTALSTFLLSPSALTWIQILAMQDQLKTLVYSSRSLSAFADRRRILDASVAPNLRPIQALEVIDLWAVDLVKIVGRFGQKLLDVPDTIFKFVPQFCPQESIIHRQFGKRSAFTVSFSGGSNTAWDDSLAKLFVGANAQALTIRCAGNCFAVLTSANKVIIWDSTTCLKQQELSHQEIILAICASTSGKRLAAYGPRNIRIYETSSGKQLQLIAHSSGSRPLAMAFSHKESEILFGSDDGIVRSISLDRTDARWHEEELKMSEQEATFAGAMTSNPCSMAFNPDGSQVAVAFRGAPLSVWGLGEQGLVSRCRRSQADRRFASARPWTAANNVLWHPQSGEVIGIYQDATVFRWDPLEDSSHDLPLTATAIALSPDGELLATSDANGAVKISRFPDFGPTWLLRCDYPVADLAFSPDNKRLYDIRGSFCNVWEPNALVRLFDLDAPGSEARSESGITIMSATISEAEVDISEPISALAVAPHGDFICVGNTEGAVRLLTRSGGEAVELWQSSNFMPVEQITWSMDGGHIALCDIGGTVVVKRIESAGSSTAISTMSAKSIFEATPNANDGPLEQLLFNQQASLLLLGSAASAQVWSIESGSCISRWESKSANTTNKWIQHPSHPDQLLRIGAEKAYHCGWQNLVERSTTTFNIPNAHEQPSSPRTDRIRKPSLPRSMSSDDTDAVVDKAILTHDGAHIIIETTRFLEGRRSERQLMIFSRSEFDGSRSFVSPKQLPFPLLGRLQLPLDVLPRNTFVFLDNDNWVCSWHLGSTDGTTGIERHFFLPRGWLNAECLELCTMVASGDLIVPKDGEIAMITSDLAFQW